MTHICIVEDDDSIRQLLKLTLENFQYEITDFDNGEDAYQYLLDNKVDLAILDLMLPRMNGYDILKQIRQNKLNRETPVIILSAKDQEVDKILGLDLGADDYITKPFSVRELVARVKANLRKIEVETNNSQVIRPDATKKKESKIVVGDLELDLDKFEVKVRGEVVELTLREFEVLKFLASQPEQVVTRETLLEKVWGYEYYGDIRTVDVTVRRIREKIEKDTSAPKILITKRSVGYYISSGK